MKEFRLTAWFAVLLCAVGAALVVYAQDVGIEELMNEMKTPAGTNVAVTEPVAEGIAPAEAVESAKPVEAPAVEEAPAPAVAAEPEKPAEAPVIEEMAAPAVAAEPEKPAEAPVIEEMAAPAVEAPAPVEKPAVAIEDLVPAAAPAKVEEVPVIEDLIAPSAPVAPAVQAPEVVAPAAEVPVAEVAPEVAPVEPAAVAPAPGNERNEMARVLSQQEEVRRQAREMEGRKSMESADKSWKDDDYERALVHYRNALSKLPTTPAAESLRRRAGSRIPECEYQVVLALVSDGKKTDALRRGKEFLNQNAENRSLQKLVARIEKDAKEDKAEDKPPKASEVAQSEIRKQMLIGKKAMTGRDYELARSSFESVLALDPQNRQAMGYLKELGDREYIASTTERQATAAKMSAQVRNTWNPQYKVIKAKEEKKEGDKTPKPIPLLAKMDKIIIPEIEFRQANIHDVVSFLNKAAVEGDKETADPSKRGVNIILNLNPGGTAAAPKPAAAADDLFGGTAPAGGGGGGQTYEITFQARYISLLQTLKTIMSVAGLKYRIDGDIVMIVPVDFDPAQIEIRMYPVEPTFIEKVREASAAMPAANETRGGREFTGIGEGGLNTGLPDLKAYFTQMGVPFPAGASITYNSAIGKVIVGNTADNLATFERLLAELNVVPKQVEIEARFVEVNETDLMEAGLEWLLTDAFELATKKGGGALGGQERIVMNANSANGGFTRGLRFWGSGGDGAATTLAGGQGSLGRMASISSVLTNPELTMVLHLLQQNGNADLLSAPKVTTRSGAEASIRVVTEYIYPTSFRDADQNAAGGGNNSGGIIYANPPPVVLIPEDFATREVGVLLTVLPEVSPDGNMINLTMQPQVVTEPLWYQYGTTLPDGNGGSYEVNIPQPFFHVRSLNTSISIYDGATVVMGGLITEDLTKVNDKIPVLGDIPLLGALFRSKSERSIKKNLLIFVTAKLVDPAGRLIRQPEGDTVTPAAMVPAAPH